MKKLLILALLLAPVFALAQTNSDGTVTTPEPTPVQASTAPDRGTVVTATPNTQVKTAPSPTKAPVRNVDEDCDDSDRLGCGNYLDDDDDGDTIGDYIGDPDFDLLRISEEGDIDVSLTVTNEGRDRLQAAIEAGDVTVRGWDPKKKEVIVGPEQVNTTEQLADYAAALSLADDRIRAMDSDATAGNLVRYRSEGTLLWVKRVNFDITATVRPPAEGEKYGRVKVRFPWYSFLIRRGVKAADIEADVSKELTAHELTHVIQRQAQMFNTLSNILKAHHDAAKSIIQNIRG
jgi:hypothetical protein